MAKFACLVSLLFIAVPFTNGQGPTREIHWCTPAWEMESGYAPTVGFQEDMVPHYFENPASACRDGSAVYYRMLNSCALMFFAECKPDPGLSEDLCMVNQDHEFKNFFGRPCEVCLGGNIGYMDGECNQR
eukprot:CAMPEP_0114586566 /NCGR_PEP_ID=MMETSP0125-20121206/9749_1 /TAXON_ID=485358 ORGANISM="Aristerostoma sp., Strain ATCC 50986" /NCGR_SAMPLE_ID=MMETSP0125 /ASSEMBLY_ACC=CAM_ASM_000245 /LENGTH=129 /DNA_ID=CAMNT_0001782051 /DNA_START=18 /DNA_END=407 /DNA_ORIENTATION=+